MLDPIGESESLFNRACLMIPEQILQFLIFFPRDNRFRLSRQNGNSFILLPMKIDLVLVGNELNWPKTSLLKYSEPPPCHVAIAIGVTIGIANGIANDKVM